MSHRFHPDPEQYDDHPEAILWDDCADCERHTERMGLTLDPKNWWAMWDRMLGVEIEGDESYLSHNEAKLGREMYSMYVALERYAPGVEPTLAGMRD